MVQSKFEYFARGVCFLEDEVTVLIYATDSAVQQTGFHFMLYFGDGQAATGSGCHDRLEYSTSRTAVFDIIGVAQSRVSQPESLRLCMIHSFVVRDISNSTTEKCIL